jgi:hypothetical protein
MSRRVSSKTRETQEISRALRRAARKALELGMKTGTPVYVIRDNKIVDLTKDQPATSGDLRKSQTCQEESHVGHGSYRS